MRILSLFDGMSCGRVALDRIGIAVEKYYASEIDKYAIQVAQAMYPDTEQIGDVLSVDFTKYIGKVDVIIGGSPCQDLSIAKQNRQGLQGERSRLFWEYVRALSIIKPKYFLLENVASMKSEDRDAITAVLRGIYPECTCTMINAALVSAQQRKRYYWTNIPNISQPEDKGVLLKDILESGCGYLNKSQSLTASYDGAVFWNSIQRRQRTMVCEPVADNFYLKEKNLKHCLRNFGAKAQNITGKDKCTTICASMGAGGGNVPYMFEPVPAALRSYPRIKINDEPRVKRLEVKSDNKANSITSVQTDSMVCEPIRVGTLPNLGKGQANRIYSVRGKSICLNANGGGGGAKTGLYKIDLPDGDYTVRKLTPRECCRLQTYDERCFDICPQISNTQWYKMFGNGWCVDVIAHIFAGLKDEQ